MGVMFQQQEKYDRAIDHYHKSLKIKPGYAMTHYKLAQTLHRQGKIDEAIDQLTLALEVNENEFPIHTYLGILLQEQDENNQAIKYYNKSLQLKPGQPQVLHNLACIYLDQGNISEAIIKWEKAIDIGPDYAIAYSSLARVFEQQGKIKKAIELYRAAIDLENEAFIEVQNNLAWLLATHKEAKLTYPDEAIDLAEDICQQSGYKNPAFLDTLAVAYAAAGRFAEAVSTAQKALELAGPLNDKVISEEIDSHLQLFKAGKAYRQ